jgi:hypothetical protein
MTDQAEKNRKSWYETTNRNRKKNTIKKISIRIQRIIITQKAKINKKKERIKIVDVQEQRRKTTRMERVDIEETKSRKKNLIRIQRIIITEIIRIERARIKKP